jgi:hypothetical protein
MKKIILVDIDHTLSDAYHRDPMIGIAPWDEYHAGSIEDDPAHDMVDFLNNSSLHEHYEIIGLTSRPEKFRQLTMQWLARHEIKLDDLWMRGDKDYRPAQVVKISKCEEKLGEGWQRRILFMIDDNERVIAAFKAEGVSALQIFHRRGAK